MSRRELNSSSYQTILVQERVTQVLLHRPTIFNTHHRLTISQVQGRGTQVNPTSQTYNIQYPSQTDNITTKRSYFTDLQYSILTIDRQYHNYKVLLHRLTLFNIHHRHITSTRKRDTGRSYFTDRRLHLTRSTL